MKNAENSQQQDQNQVVALDANLRKFLQETMSGQSLALAAWATTIIRQGSMTMKDLERCLNLGFEF